MKIDNEYGKEGVKIAVVLSAALLLFLFSIVAVAAAPPSTLGIQGRLIDPATGEALVGTYSVTFDIYNVGTGGSPLFTQVQSVDTDVNGLYSVVLNGVTATFGEQYWLGVEVASDGEMEPRLNFTAAPYAFNSLNLSCTDCIDATQVEDIYILIAGDTMGGNLDLGTNSLTSVGGVSLGNGALISTTGTNVIIDDPLQVNGPGTSSITGILTTSSNFTVNTNTLHVDATNGRVGIGTTSPGATLHVEGGAATFKVGDTDDSVIFADTNTFTVEIGDRNYASNNALFTVDDAAQKFTFENGNVGIGTTSPSEMLEVDGNVSLNRSLYVHESGRVGIGLSYPTEKLEIRGNMTLKDEGYDAYIRLVSDDAASSTSAYIWSEDNVGFAVGELLDTPQFVVRETTGNVGIGTSSPAQKLQIVARGAMGIKKQGLVMIEGIGSGPGMKGIYINVTNTTGVFQAGIWSEFIQTVDGGNTGVGVYGASNATSGVGVSGYGTLYGVKGETSGAGYGVVAVASSTGKALSASGNVDISGNTTIDTTDNVLFVDITNNKVGIGTTNPNQALHVIGNINASGPGNIYYEGNLTGYGADIAELIYAAVALEAGDVVIIAEADETVTKSSKPYDTRVAGIISSDPSHLISADKGDVPLALSGRVPVKASAENGPIRHGDLLTTSNTPGHVMRCKTQYDCIGSTVGKAMGSLEEGTGTLTALVMLG